MSKLSYTLAAIVIAVASGAHAASPTVGGTVAPQAEAQPALFDAANAHLLRAQKGDKDAIDEAVKAFADLVKTDPTNPVFLAHLGSATSMQARTTLNPFKKMSYAEDGMSLQDKALALLKPEHDAQLVNGNPMALYARFVVASTWLAVPSFFNRGPRGERLLNDVLASPLFESAALQFRGSVWMRAAGLAVEQKRSDDVRRYLNLVIEAGAPQASEAKDKLASLQSAGT